MKRYFLFISAVFCFLAAIAGTGNFRAHDSSCEMAAVEAGYSTSSANYPHTELEVHSHSVSLHSVVRQQSLAGNATATACTSDRFTVALPCVTQSNSHLSFKQYLSHNYPSHNFW